MEGSPLHGTQRRLHQLQVLGALLCIPGSVLLAFPGQLQECARCVPGRSLAQQLQLVHLCISLLKVRHSDLLHDMTQDDCSMRRKACALCWVCHTGE